MIEENHNVRGRLEGLNNESSFIGTSRRRNG
jgi:hypothetical protein